MGSIICVGNETEGLASITTHPLLRQRLKNARQLMQGVPNQIYTLLRWIKTVIFTMRVNVGELPDTVSKWYTYAELTQVMRELGMKQSIFNSNTRGPDDCFTRDIQDAIMSNAHSTSCGSLTAILAPYVGHPIYEVTSMVSSFEGKGAVAGKRCHECEYHKGRPSW